MDHVIKSFVFAFQIVNQDLRKSLFRERPYSFQRAGLSYGIVGIEQQLL